MNETPSALVGHPGPQRRQRRRRLSRRYPTVEIRVADVCVDLEDDDIERVEVGIDRLARVGTGATGQRRTFAKTGQLVDVVVEAVRRTAGR